MRRPQYYCILLLALLLYPLVAADASPVHCLKKKKDASGSSVGNISEFTRLRRIASHVGRFNKGGFIPIDDISDPHWISMAEFAVSEYNKQSPLKNHLVFQNLVRAWYQIVGGKNYKLVITVTDSLRSPPLNYEATVYEDMFQAPKELTSFDQVKN